jgi:hypothetical protein
MVGSLKGNESVLSDNCKKEGQDYNVVVDGSD